MPDHPDQEHAAIARILVGTDFSESSAVALDRAMGIAKPANAELVILHVGGFSCERPMPPELQAEVNRNLAGLEDIARRGGVRATSECRPGKPWEVLSAAALETEADLIVVGSRGRTVYSRFILGSTADRVVRTAPVPVLTVHPEDGAPSEGIRTILVATDFSEEAALAMSAAARLAASIDGCERMILLHVRQPDMGWATEPMMTPVALEIEGDEEEARACVESLAVPWREAGFDVQTVVRSGYPATMIEEEAASAGADLIVVGTRGRSGLSHLMLGSVAERVVHHAPCPVLTVRRAESTKPVQVALDAGQTTTT